MESLHASRAAEPQPSTSGDVKMPAQIEEPSLATREGADGLKDKTGRGAEQQANLESPQKGGKATDDLWLQVKTEIKEEIEDDMRSSSFDCELPLRDVRVKDENAEEQHQNPKNSGYEVATEEMVPEQSMIPARSQATAEPESKPAKRRRLTRRDVQKTMHTEGLNSAKKELPDAVKVKTERCAEQQVKLESPQKRMEMDDFQLRVKTEIKEEIEDEMRSSSFDCELPLQDVRVKDENAEEQHQNPKNSGYEVANEEMVPEQSMIPARSQAAAEPEPKPAKRRRLTRRDLQQTLQTDGLSSAKKEIPDGVKVKTERCAEQQVKLESPQKRMEMDDFQLRVKTEIKEEIEDEMRSSSFDCELPLQDVRVKDENAEEQHQNPKNSGYEVANEEMVPEQSMIPARSQAAAEPEPKPAKRRRLTRRDLQQTLQTDGLSSAKKEIPDGVKVKTERCAEQQANLESPQKRMEMDDLWLRVREEIRKQSGVILAASSQAAGNAMQPSEKDSGSSEAQASCQRHQEPSEHSTQDTAQVVGQEDRCWENRLQS